jgi:uncharacterized protein YwgA
MGVLESDWSEKRKVYAEHCPDGFEIEYVEGREAIKAHEGIKAAYAKNQEQAQAAAQEPGR